MEEEIGVRGTCTLGGGDPCEGAGGWGGRSRMGAGNTRRHKWGNRSVGGLRLHEGYPRGTGKLASRRGGDRRGGRWGVGDVLVTASTLVLAFS